MGNSVVYLNRKALEEAIQFEVIRAKDLMIENLQLNLFGYGMNGYIHIMRKNKGIKKVLYGNNYYWDFPERELFNWEV